MKKRININFSNKTFYTISALAIIALFAIGVYAYGGTSPSTMGHTLYEIEGSSLLSWGIPIDVQITEGTPQSHHNGDFGGYDGMKQFALGNGCDSDYHVCSGDEITKYLQHNSLSISGWYNSGVDSHGDCRGWTSSSELDNGKIFFNEAENENYPIERSCNEAFPVLCCKSYGDSTL